MFSQDQLNAMAKELISRLGSGGSTGGSKGKGGADSSSSNKGRLEITPSQALVIAGILGGTLDVVSVLVDRDQTVQILLEGSLKRKTELENMFEQIGKMPFDEVLKAMLGRI